MRPNDLATTSPARSLVAPFRRAIAGYPQWYLRLVLQFGQAIVVAFAVVSVAFFLVRLVPGDPARAILGPRGSPEAIAALRHAMHLDGPILSGYGSYVWQLLHGDLGSSIIQEGRSVSGIIGAGLPVTLALIAGTVLISVVVAVPLGLLAAVSRRKPVDQATRAVLVTLLAMPPFFLGLLLILLVALRLALLPAGGWGDGWPDNLRYVILPSVALSGYLMPLIARTVRQVALDTVREEFIEAAVARGLPRRTIVLRHVLPNSLLPVLTLLGLNLGSLIAGAVVVESVFGLPGVGSSLVQAVSARDYPLIQGIAVVSALFVVFGNVLADMLYVVVDPRTRRG
jgi:peptide/nickel transport system permease protein